MTSSSNKLATFAGAVVLCIGVGVAYFYRHKFTSSTTSPADNKRAPESEKYASSESIAVEDVCDEEDENDEDDDDDNAAKAEAARQEELKAQYDDILRVAKKLLNGQSYIRAAEKFTEAIALSEQIPTAKKDTVVLYNNRSAMYEKANDLTQSLLDINIILTIDPYHTKGRIRKARIHEAKQDHKSAIIDYLISLLILQSQQNHEAIDELTRKIEGLIKCLSLIETKGILDQVRNSSENKALPSKSYCRNFLEAFPSIHEWSLKYKGFDRNELLSKIENVGENIVLKLESELELVYYDLCHASYSRAFEKVNALVIDDLDATLPNESNLISIVAELKGTETFLRRDLKDAISFFKDALKYNSINVEASLKLASLHVELGELDEASDILATVIKIIDEKSDESLLYLKAWTLLHKATLSCSKDMNFILKAENIENGLNDIELVLAMTVDKLDDPKFKALRLISLLKSVHILSQLKPTCDLGMGVVSEDDKKRSIEYVKECQNLSPDHTSVLILEVDMLIQDGQLDRALEAVDKIITKHVDSDDCVPYVVKANLMIQQGMGELQNAQMMNNEIMTEMAKNRLSEFRVYFEKAIEVEPNSVEALAQYGQYKNMFLQDSEGALVLVAEALKHARNRDEVLELCMLKSNIVYQLAALDELKKISN